MKPRVDSETEDPQGMDHLLADDPPAHLLSPSRSLWHFSLTTGSHSRERKLLLRHLFLCKLDVCDFFFFFEPLGFLFGFISFFFSQIITWCFIKKQKENYVCKEILLFLTIAEQSLYIKHWSINYSFHGYQSDDIYFINCGFNFQEEGESFSEFILIFFSQVDWLMSFSG